MPVIQQARILKKQGVSGRPLLLEDCKLRDDQRLIADGWSNPSFEFSLLDYAKSRLEIVRKLSNSTWVSAKCGGYHFDEWSSRFWLEVVASRDIL